MNGTLECFHRTMCSYETQSEDTLETHVLLTFHPQLLYVGFDGGDAEPH